MDEMENLITKQEIATRYNVSGRTVNKWMTEGMPTIRIAYRLVRFDPAQVKAWIDQKRNALKDQ